MRRDRLSVGRIRRAHGTEGWLRVDCFASHCEHLASLTELAMDEHGETWPVREVRIVPGGLLVKLEGLDTREQAERLGRRVVWVAREMASPASVGEYYVGDLEGCTVLQGSRVVGTVTSFVEGGATELLEVRGTDGEPFLVPFLDAYVGEVSVERGVVELKEVFDIEAVRRTGRSG